MGMQVNYIPYNLMASKLLVFDSAVHINCKKLLIFLTYKTKILNRQNIKICTNVILKAFYVIILIMCMIVRKNTIGQWPGQKNVLMYVVSVLFESDVY